MIAWNAFLDYIVLGAEHIMFGAPAILLGAFLTRKRRWVGNIYEAASRIPNSSILFSILALALVLRVGWVLWSPHVAPSAATEDMVILNHARDLEAGRGYLESARLSMEAASRIDESLVYSADRPFGYALWLAILFRLFGENMMLVELFQAAFATLTVFLLYRLGREVFGRGAGLMGAFVLAVYPTSIFASKIVLEEHLFIPMWLAGMTLLVQDFKQPNWKKMVIAGLAFGVAAHFRTYAFAMGLVVLAVWMLVKRQFRQGIVRAVTLQILILLLAAPWAVRNYHKLGAPVLYSSWIGPILYFSNNQSSDVRYPVNPTPEQGADMNFLRAQSEVERDRAGKRAAWNWIVANPGTFLDKAVGRVIYMLGITREGWVVKDNFHNIKEGRSPPSTKLLRALDKLDNDAYAYLFFLALVGFIFFFSFQHYITRQSFWFVLFSIAYYLSIVAITLGHKKYRFSIEPLFCLAAGFALYQLFLGFAAKRFHVLGGNKAHDLSRQEKQPVTSCL